MRFLEKNLEDIICDGLADKEIGKSIAERGLTPIGVAYRHQRQVRIGNYGVADIITLTRTEQGFLFSIYELKKSVIDLDTLLQASRYRAGLSSYLRKKLNNETSIAIECILIGDKVSSDSDWIYLPPMMRNNISVYTYNYQFDGIHFKNEEMKYSLTNEGF
jgi:hypothetical protein